MTSNAGAFFCANTEARQSSINGGPTIDAITTETTGGVLMRRFLP